MRGYPEPRKVERRSSHVHRADAVKSASLYRASRPYRDARLTYTELMLLKVQVSTAPRALTETLAARTQSCCWKKCPPESASRTTLQHQESCRHEVSGAHALVTY